jgi:lysophospholipase
MQKAPYHAHLADGPEDAEAFWLTASDGLRVRMGVMGPKTGKGTVLLFPGRTEYVEKYGRAGRDLAAAGYATAVIDWRGQGLADRLTLDRMSGHVLNFTDYQKDVAAMVAAAKALDLPKPFHLLAHSMGGCIGLRALMEGLPVASSVFSGPMWGVQLKTAMRAIAWTISWGSRRVGLDHVYAPTSTNTESYVLIEPFETNKLTRDREMYQYMIDQTRACPELGLGGPSLRWLHEALAETRALSHRPSPSLPCLTFAGTDETIVDLARINDRMEAWSGAQMEWIEGGRHEVLMDTTETRERVFGQIAAFFDAHSTAQVPLSRPA